MTAASRFAFGNARVRAMKSRLRAHAALVPAHARAAEERSGFRELLSAYDTLLSAYPDGADLVLAFLRLHEIENLKLGWRASAHSVPIARWMPLWRPLGRHASLDPEAFRSASVVRNDFHGLLEGAPAPPDGDPSAAERLWDRWGSEKLLAAARDLPSREIDARRIVFALVRERDLQVLRRSVSRFGLTPGAAAATTALLRSELGREDLERLATWKPGEVPLSRRVMKTLGLPAGPPPADWPAIELALRRGRRALCRKAFRDSPFCLAPAIAYLSLKEEELRSVRAVAESRRVADVEETLRLVLAAGPMEH